MKLNRKWLLAIALVLSLTMAIGGTLAYLTDRDTVENTFTMGNVDIEVEEDFPEGGSPIKPGETVNKDAKIANEGSNPAWVWMTVSIPETLKDYVTLNWANGFAPTSNSPVVENGEAVWTVLVEDQLPAGESTEYILDSVTMSDYVDYQNGKYVVVQNGETVPLEGLVDGQLIVTVTGYAAQVEGLNTVAEAYAAYQGQWGDGGADDDEDPDHVCWDGTADTSWYNENDTEFVITTAEQLAGLAKLVDDGNTFAGKTIKLGNDICLSGEQDTPIPFDPIGYGYDIVFKGTFDGQDNTISNLYQDGDKLGLAKSTAGGGLFASAVDANFKDLTIDKAEIVMNCIDMGTLVGYSYGTCTYENITVSNSLIGNYQRYTGGVVGEVNGTHHFKNVDVTDCHVAALWGDFDTSLGGIIGGKWGDATVTMEDCDVKCRIDAYNDAIATESKRWHAYRRSGMLIGNTQEQTSTNGGHATATFLTTTNCTVTYGDWANYTYCEFTTGPNSAYPYVRVQDGYQTAAYSNVRYGHPVDADGNEVVDENHTHHEGEEHHGLKKFDQLYGSDVGVYGTATHDGVTVVYPD